MRMSCWDNDCKYFKEFCGEYACTLNPKFAITGDDFDCPNCVTAKNCLTCKHSYIEVYETGTIDCIEYYCSFQGKKVIYNDSDPMNCHHYDIPECNIDKWEE